MGKLKQVLRGIFIGSVLLGNPANVDTGSQEPDGVVGRETDVRPEDADPESAPKRAKNPKKPDDKKP
jgi:hypothetical protein